MRHEHLKLVVDMTRAAIRIAARVIPTFMPLANAAH